MSEETNGRMFMLKVAALIVGLMLSMITLTNALDLFGGVDAPSREEFSERGEEIDEHVEDYRETREIVNRQQDRIEDVMCDLYEQRSGHPHPKCDP